MKLTWPDYSQIAEQLFARYEDMDLLNITPEEIRQLVVALPDFADSPTPADPELLEAILSVWITLRDPDIEGGRWDAYV